MFESSLNRSDSSFKFTRFDSVSKRFDAVNHDDRDIVLVTLQQDWVSLDIDLLQREQVSTIRLEYCRLSFVAKMAAGS